MSLRQLWKGTLHGRYSVTTSDQRGGTELLLDSTRSFPPCVCRCLWGDPREPRAAGGLGLESTEAEVPTSPGQRGAEGTQAFLGRLLRPAVSRGSNLCESAEVWSAVRGQSREEVGKCAEVPAIRASLPLCT